jgi:predicted PurR-regulated permease PerM
LICGGIVKKKLPVPLDLILHRGYKRPMKITVTALLFLAALAALSWILWPVISPYVEKAKTAQPVKVRRLNPFP